MRRCGAPKWRPTSRRYSSSGSGCCLKALLDLFELAPLVMHFAPELFNVVLHLRHVGIAQPFAEPLPRLLGDLAIALPDAIELLVFEFLEVEQHVVRALGDPDQLVELHLDSLAVAVLR